MWCNNRKKWVKFWLCIFIILFISSLSCTLVYATTFDDYDLESGEFEDESFYNISFSDITKSLYSADYSFRNPIIEKIVNLFFEEIRLGIKSVILVFGIIISGAVIKTMIDIFKEDSISKTASLLMYSFVMVILIALFESLYSVATDATKRLMNFLYSIIPTFFCAFSFTQGSLNGGIMYQWTGLVLSLVNAVNTYVIIPFVNFYMIIMVINNAIDDKNLFSGFLTLIKKGISYANRGMIGIIVGMTSIKSMTLPLTTGLRNTLIKKSVSMIPGIGNGVEAVTETIAGAGNLIRNSIGAAGIVVVVLIMIIPFIKLFAVNIILKVLVAISQPISEKNVIRGINGMSEAIGMLMSVMCTTAMVFIITMTIICMVFGV